MKTNKDSLNELIQCSAIEASGLFDANYYLDNNTDVYLSGIDPILHYVRFGENEKRSPSEHFNPNDYAKYKVDDNTILYDYIAIPQNIRKMNENDSGKKAKGLKKEYTIVFSTNDKYLPLLSVALISLLKNANSNIIFNVKILYNELSSKNLETFGKIRHANLKYEFVALPSNVKDVILYAYTSDHITIEAYFRILIPEIFKNKERVLYLDSDLIVLKDISYIYQLDLGNNLLAGARNFFLKNPYHDKLWNSLPQKVANNYFNSGVLIFNIKQMNAEKIYEKFMRMLKSGQEYMCHDQDILNVACADRIKNLGFRWNLQWHYLIKENYKLLYSNSFKTIMKESHDPAIIHFTTGTKALQYNDGNFVNLFWQYAKESPFFEKLKHDCAYDLHGII